MIMTSVSGHLLSLDFASAYRKWYITHIHTRATYSCHVITCTCLIF